MPGGTSRRKDVPGPSWDGVNELALATFTAGVAGVAGVCMVREDMMDKKEKAVLCCVDLVWFKIWFENFGGVQLKKSMKSKNPWY